MDTQDNWPPLYQVYWSERGKVLNTHITSVEVALKRMERLLAQGKPSWMVPVPYREEDMPF